MDVTLLQEQLRRSEERNEALAGELRRSGERSEATGREVASLRAEFASLRRDYETLVEATGVLARERDALRQRVAEVEAVNSRLVDMLWGRRSERRSESPDQQHLNFGDEPADPPGAAEQAIITAESQVDEARDRELLRRLAARRKARREKQEQGRREEFPPDIERRERLLDLPEDEKEGLRCIGVKVSERMRFEKPHVYVEVIKRPQYVVPGQPAEGVRSMPPPLAIVEGSKYDFSVVAAMATLKFAFHLPTYRQQDWFAQCGWFPSRSTVNDLLNYAVATSAPLYQEMWRLLLAEPILLGDDTTLPVLLRGALGEEDLAKLTKRNRFRQILDVGLPADARLLPGSATSYAWLYTGLDGAAPYNVFHWSLTHQNSAIDGHLATYRGIFVGDACGANVRLQERSGGRIVHASCNAHARREFIQAESNDPVLASQAVSFYHQLYDVEERGKTLDADARRQLRQRDAVPIWGRMRQWLQSDAVKRALPRSRIGEAIGYLRNQWSALTVYLSDGRIPIDNDQSEQIIRPLVVGRGNWLFLGHPQAAPGRGGGLFLGCLWRLCGKGWGRVGQIGKTDTSRAPIAPGWSFDCARPAPKKSDAAADNAEASSVSLLGGSASWRHGRARPTYLDGFAGTFSGPVFSLWFLPGGDVAELLPIEKESAFLPFVEHGDGVRFLFLWADGNLHV